MDKLIRHVRHRLISGVVVLIPAVISFMVLKLLYNLTVGIVSSSLRPLFKEMPAAGVALISLFALAFVLYILGGLAANMIGRRLIHQFEQFVSRLPLVDSIYGTAKQIVEMFRAKPDNERRAAVLVPFPHPGTRALGFLTGEVTLPDGTLMATVFVPTTPNPTTGFLQMFPMSDVQPLSVDTDQAFQYIMSAGILRLPALDRDPES